MKYKLAALMTLFSIMTACSSFVKDESMPELKKYEKATYILQKTVRDNGPVLTKNQKVKIVVMTGDSWVKVYGYPAGDDKLKTGRSLLLYLFDDDFVNDEFNIKVFEQELFKVVKIKR